MATAFTFDFNGTTLRYVDSGGTINTLSLTSADSVYIANGGFQSLSAMCGDSAGNLYVYDNKPASNIAVLYKITPNGVVTHVAGQAGHAGSQTGLGSAATSAGLAGFASPYSPSVTTDAAGNIYLADYNRSTILAINTQGTTQTLFGVSIPAGCIQVIAGTPGSNGFTGDSGPATSAKINTQGTQSLAISPAGELYFGDPGNLRIRKITTGGTISTYLGNGSALNPYGDGGPIGSAQTSATCLIFDAAGNLYIGENNWCEVRAINTQGTTQTFYNVSIAAGNINRIAGIYTCGTDTGNGGQATSARINTGPMLIDGSGNLILGSNNNTIRSIASSGVITNIAGTGTNGNTGDGGPATSANIGPVQGLFLGLINPAPPNARVDQLVREAWVVSNPNARVDGLWRETWLTSCTPPTPSSLLYVKSFQLTSGSLYITALDAAGTLWYSNQTLGYFLMEPLVTNILPGSYMLSTTQADVEYMCFSNLLQGTDIPRQYNPQPSVGAFTLDRTSQVGPGAPPSFQSTTTVAASQATITSWAAAGGIVTFQAVNTFTAGEVVSLSGFAVSTFFNGQKFSVLGTGLSGTQFEVAFSGTSGGSDSGLATPQYGYPISRITQPSSQTFDNQDALLSAGPGQVSPGTTLTFYYRKVSDGPPDTTLVNAFNSGRSVYVYVSGAPIGNGTQLVTGVGSDVPPGAGSARYYFTVQATTSSYNQQANGGSYQMSVATLTTSSPIPGLSDGDEITVTGATPSGWNNTWTLTQTLNAGVYSITQTSMAGGNATYSWQWSGAGTAVAPVAGQLVTVIQTLNGNGIFNVTDAAIASVAGGPSSGTFVINNLGTSSQNVPAAAETGQAQTAGTSFQFDPGSITLGTTQSPIYGTGSAGIVAVAGSNTSVAAGTRQAVVFFETRSGYKTACSIPITFTTNAAATYILSDQIPLGPPNVVRRWIAFTTAGPNGIPGPNFYTIDAPVSFTINNQTFLYTPTYIDDNVSTSAKFTFTDAVLLAGEEIDVLGNNLFNLIELGSSAWNIAYSQRMFYGLEQNKVLNFNNLTFDGGFLPNPGGSVFPSGWSVDAASNQITIPTVNVTAYQVKAGPVPLGGGGVPRINSATFTANNNFTAGTTVTLAGFSTAEAITYFNGLIAIVLSATSVAFTIKTVAPAISLTADTGTATAATATGNLIASPIFGNSYYINNQGSGTAATLGMITQSAYQDAYNVPIILPNTLYSVRVRASAPSGKTVGSLVIDLTGSNLGFYSGASGSLYGSTYGSFVLPLASMTTSLGLYSGTLLTSPFLTGVPVGLLLRVWAQNIGAGADILIDRIEVYPTAQPLLSTNIRVSYPDNFESFDGVTGNLGLASHSTQPAFGAFVMHDQLYFLQSASMQSTQDVPGIEPSNPGGGWSLHEVSNRVGTCGIHAYDYGEEWMLTACRNGVYGFNGGQPIRIDFQQRELWELINWNYGHTIWLRNDLVNSRILVGVPMPTPNKWLPFAATNTNPTSPNVVLMWNYQNLNTFEEIVSGRGVHTTMFGTLAAVDMRLKASIWQITSPYAGFVMQSDLHTMALTVCNGVGNQKMYQLSADQLSDDGAAIYSAYWTFGFVDSARAKENPLLGLHRKRYQIVQQLIQGSGVATMQAWPNYIINQQTLVANPDVWTDPGGITLQWAPPDDIVRPLNAAGNRVFLSYSTNAVGAVFHLSKVILVGTIDPATALNPNSG